MTPRVLVVVPTTGGPLLLRRLAARPGLPHPAAFTEGDYRPLALSADYRLLAGSEGPIVRHLGRPLPPHELRLSGEPDGGRSWEGPVVLAHLIQAAGGTLATTPEEADLLLWATGAVDLDLRLLPGDYALALKVRSSRSLLEGMGDLRVVAVLPPGPGRDEAAAALRGLQRAVMVDVIAAEALDEVLVRRVQRPDALDVEPTERSSTARGSPRWATVGVAAVAVWLLWSGVDRSQGADQRLVALVDPAQGVGLNDGPPSEFADATTTPDDPPAEPSMGRQEVTPSPLPHPAVIEEVRAAPGSSCRAALFDPSVRVLVPVAREGAGFAASILDAELCGVALRPSSGVTLGPVEVDPPDAFVAAPPSDGAVTLFLRGPPRDVVYRVPVLQVGEDQIIVEHRLTAPMATTD